jgi:cytosine/adenosine deaminase-related metal-dependent hydrolase
MGYLLKNLSWSDGSETIVGDVRIGEGIILEVGKTLDAGKRDVVIDLPEHFIYPGLVNAHDHLEMNLYPKLGKPPYKNYVEWGNDIYHPRHSPLLEIESVNIQDRLLWGGLKNLISGATTVIHHNPWHLMLGKNDFPVKVQKVAWAHSLAFEKKSNFKLPEKHRPFVIHAGEGIDELSFAEIPTLKRMDLLKNNTVLIHAIALTGRDIETLATTQCSVVWCPASNLFMFDRTANITEMVSRIRIALGSDSTLTGSSTLLDEMQTASKSKPVSARQIYDMVTTIPADIFSLNNRRIFQRQPADLFITSKNQGDYFENLLDAKVGDISLVMVSGMPRIAASDTGIILKNTVKIQGKTKGCVYDIAGLKKRIEKKVGQSTLEQNPLWNLMET